ncbi:MAG: 30S ribosomal protein S6 [Acidobacteriota bacterium]
MRRYEVVFVLAPGLTDDEVEHNIELFTKAAEEKGAAIAHLENWGKRRLAYPVKKHNEGFYIILTIEEPGGEAVAELERRFKVMDAVIRFLSVRVDLDLKRADKFKTRREEHKKQRAASGARKRGEQMKETLIEKE